MIASVLLLLSGIAQESRPDPSRFLTDHFHKLWKKHRIEPASKCEDLAFLRRVSLDLIGRIPDRVERDTFLKLPQAKRRKLWIDRLLERSEHAQFLSRLWSSRLMPTPSESFRGWCESQLKRNVSYRELVINLITASGASRSNGAVHFILQHLGSPLPKSKRGKAGQHDLIPLTGRVMRSFLSLTVDCA